MENGKQKHSTSDASPEPNASSTSAERGSSTTSGEGTGHGEVHGGYLGDAREHKERAEEASIRELDRDDLLKDLIRSADEIKETLATDGWNKNIRPWLQNYRDLNADLSTLPDDADNAEIKARKKLVKFIDDLSGQLETTLQGGELAAEELRE